MIFGRLNGDEADEHYVMEDRSVPKPLELKKCDRKKETTGLVRFLSSNQFENEQRYNMDPLEVEKYGRGKDHMDQALQNSDKHEALHRWKIETDTKEIMFYNLDSIDRLERVTNEKTKKLTPAYMKTEKLAQKCTKNYIIETDLAHFSVL